MCSSDIFLGFIAFLFPPLPVWVKCGVCSADSIINILLCCLGFIPGLLHSWYIIAKFPDPSDYQPINNRQDAESGRVAYVYVAQTAPSAQPQRKSAPGYGTTATIVAPPLHQESNGAWSNAPAGEGSSAGPAAAPPTYAQAVKGDNKIQSSD